jgi:nitrate/TMAO reductase-like tetraheme cytochrome c subunit
MTRHPLSIAGAWLTTLSALVFLFVFVIDLFALHSNPYVGLVFFVIIPMFFVLGLLMIPAGIVLEHRRRRHGLGPRRLPRIDLNDPMHQRTIVIVLALTIANVLIVSLAAYRGVEYMESPEFCGRACHTVMQPEYLAHKDGPHSRVTCVECHVGSGAQSYVYYKLNGMRQLAHLVTDNYPRPVPSPVFNLRPARGTCEMCHWPEKFHGDKVEVVPEYASDEKNTNNSTRLLLHVGGGLPQFGLGAGIHWHTNSHIEIDFVATDPKRQEIPYVRMKDAAGEIHEYRTAGADAAAIAAGERRRMDCVDCHNRPTHAFFATPERAVDFAIARGAIASDLPFVRRQTVAALKEPYADRATADREIEQRLRSFYAALPADDAPPTAAQIERLVAAAQFLHSRNVFPAMKVTWGTHLSNLGHTDAPGCFRCHDDQHKTPEGRAIRQDCELCHEIQ